MTSPQSRPGRRRGPVAAVALMLLAACGSGSGSSAPPAFERTCTFTPGGPLAASRQAGLAQTDLFAFDTNGFAAVAWSVAGSWNGPWPTTSAAVARQGAGVAALGRSGDPGRTDVFFADREGAVSVTSVVGAGDWQAPARISATGVTTSGAAIAAADHLGVPGRTDVFFVDTAGAVNVLWSAGGAWQAPLRLTPTGAAPPGGALAASAHLGVADRTDVYFVDEAGAVNVLWAVGSGEWKGPERISAVGLAPPGAGLAASAHLGVADRTDVFVFDGAGALNVLWAVGGGAWQGPAPITPAGAAPAGAAVAASGQVGLPQTDVFFVDGAGAVEVAWAYEAGAWQGPARLTATGFVPPGGVVAAAADFGAPDQTDVFVVDHNCEPALLWTAGGGPWRGPARAGDQYGVERLTANGKLLAVYDRSSATFTRFEVDGVNLIGGFSSAGDGTNYGPSALGHSADYPFGRYDAPPSPAKGRWEGFWAGFNFVNQLSHAWQGINGNPRAERYFDVALQADGSYDVHVVSEIDGPHGPDFTTDVHYYVSSAGIGVSSVVTFLRDLHTTGGDDTGGQLLMTQADIDLDPTRPDPLFPYSHARADQPSLYWKLALDGYVQEIDSFPPYSIWTPSNVYSEQERPAPPENPDYASHGLPDTARVPASLGATYLTAFDRPDRDLNLALRVDLARSTLPRLEYYCEVNGERDYFNTLYSASVGDNRPDWPYIPAGTVWHLYGDLVPWRGADPTVLRSIPFLSDVAP